MKRIIPIIPALFAVPAGASVPGATTTSTGLPDNPKRGGVWIMNAGTTTAHIMTPGS